jgi:apolipoprotein D and lipocalin family protein
VLDRADNYSWAIVGEPTGRYLWILTRSPHMSEKTFASLITRVKKMGYDTALIVRPKHAK